MVRQVVVDDTDNQITYAGRGWFQDQGSQDGQGNFGPTYKKTSHGTVSNDSLSFSFEGTSVSIFGTTNLVKIDNGTRFDPTIECFVDQISIGSADPFQFEENNWFLCGQKTLNDGPHTVTLNVTTTGHTFWLDYLTYAPSPKVTFDEAVLLVDNSDPAFLFGNGWGALGGTANMTTLVGSQAKFDFIGKSISWVGFVPKELPHAAATGSFVIDNGQPVNFRLNGLPAAATTTVYNQVFFTTPDLTPGPHSIVVTYKGGNGPSTPLTLDYLYVTNTSTPQPATAGATSSSSPSPSATGSSQGDTGNPNSKKPPVGAIVGGVIGGLALIALIFFLFWWLRRRRRAVEIKSKHYMGESDVSYRVSPFIATQPDTSMYEGRSGASSVPPPAPPFAISLPSTTSHNPGNRSQTSHPASSNFSTPSVSVPPSALSNNISHADGYSYNDGRSQPPSHTHTTSFDSSNNSGYAGGTIDQLRVMRKGQTEDSQPSVSTVLHQDSGVRLQPPARNVVIEDIPPQYTAT